MGKCVSQICYHDANGEREVIMRYPKIGIRPVIDGRGVAFVKAWRIRPVKWQKLPQN